MKKFLSRRTLGLVSVLLLGTQMLSACIILPPPGPRYRRDIVIESGHDHRHDPRHGDAYRDHGWRR